jgi:hypothetical protein
MVEISSFYETKQSVSLSSPEDGNISVSETLSFKLFRIPDKDNKPSNFKSPLLL